MTTAVLTASEQNHVDAIKAWWDSIRDWSRLSDEFGKPVEGLDSPMPQWAQECSAKLNATLWAPLYTACPDAELTPYRNGYLVGFLRWTGDQSKLKIPPEVKTAFRKIRLSKAARKKAISLWKIFCLEVGLLEQKRGRILPAAVKELNWLERLGDKYSGQDGIDFSKGVYEGRRGVGTGVPGDKSTDATDIYLVLVMYWRFIVGFKSATELHVWLSRILGKARVGEKKRIEKICQRIGLKFRKRGRPSKIPTSAPHG